MLAAVPELVEFVIDERRLLLDGRITLKPDELLPRDLNEAKPP